MSNVKLVPTLSHIIEDFEYSVHMCPTTMRNDVMKIFTEKTFADSEDIVVIPTVQKSEVDLSQAGDKQDNEKDRLLETVCDYLGSGLTSASPVLSIAFCFLGFFPNSLWNGPA